MAKWILFAASLFAATALADDAKTERAWKAKCASCHGADGKAQTEQGKKMEMRDLTTPDWQKEFSDAKIREAIENGVSTEQGGKKKSMDPYKSKLTPAQITDLVAYIRKLAK
jgi:mono/diheme cytochrome c family protein